MVDCGLSEAGRLGKEVYVGAKFLTSIFSPNVEKFSDLDTRWRLERLGQGENFHCAAVCLKNGRRGFFGF